MHRCTWIYPYILTHIYINIYIYIYIYAHNFVFNLATNLYNRSHSESCKKGSIVSLPIDMLLLPHTSTPKTARQHTYPPKCAGTTSQWYLALHIFQGIVIGFAGFTAYLYLDHAEGYPPSEYTALSRRREQCLWIRKQMKG